MPRRIAKANATKSAVRVRVERPLDTPRFAHAQQNQQKDTMRLFIRGIGIARARATITIANIAYNLGGWRWFERRTAPA